MFFHIFFFWVRVHSLNFVDIPSFFWGDGAKTTRRLWEIPETVQRRGRLFSTFIGCTLWNAHVVQQFSTRVFQTNMTWAMNFKRNKHKKRKHNKVVGDQTSLPICLMKSSWWQLSPWRLWRRQNLGKLQQQPGPWDVCWMWILQQCPMRRRCGGDGLPLGMVGMRCPPVN